VLVVNLDGSCCFTLVPGTANSRIGIGRDGRRGYVLAIWTDLFGKLVVSKWGPDIKQELQVIVDSLSRGLPRYGFKWVPGAVSGMLTGLSSMVCVLSSTLHLTGRSS